MLVLSVLISDLDPSTEYIACSQCGEKSKRIGIASIDFTNDATNRLVLASNTGVSRLQGAIGYATSGKLFGQDNVSLKSVSGYTVGTDDLYERYGTLFVNSDPDPLTFTLPSASPGMNFCFVNGQGVNAQLTVDAASGDFIVLDGQRTSVAAEYIRSSGAFGDRVCMVALDTTDWYVYIKYGTWVEEVP